MRYRSCSRLPPGKQSLSRPEDERHSGQSGKCFMPTERSPTERIKADHVPTPRIFPYSPRNVFHSEKSGPRWPSLTGQTTPRNEWRACPGTAVDQSLSDRLEHVVCNTMFTAVGQRGPLIIYAQWSYNVHAYKTAGWLGSRFSIAYTLGSRLVGLKELAL